jgi:hypothetical protein
MNGDVFETTGECGATLRLEAVSVPHVGVNISVRDDTTAIITLSYEQAHALANALIDAGF